MTDLPWGEERKSRHYGYKVNFLAPLRGRSSFLAAPHLIVSPKRTFSTRLAQGFSQAP